MIHDHRLDGFIKGCEQSFAEGRGGVEGNETALACVSKSAQFPRLRRKNTSFTAKLAENDWSQRGSLDVTAWLEWFLGCLGSAIDGAEDALTGVLRKARLWEKINPLPVNDRQRQVINRLLDGFEGKLTTSKYAKLAKCSGDTALRDISALVERGILVQNEAGGRSTSYSLAD